MLVMLYTGCNLHIIPIPTPSSPALAPIQRSWLIWFMLVLLGALQERGDISVAADAVCVIGETLSN